MITEYYKITVNPCHPYWTSAGWFDFDQPESQYQKYLYKVYWAIYEERKRVYALGGKKWAKEYEKLTQLQSYYFDRYYNAK